MKFPALILGCLATCSQAQVLPNNLNCPFNNNIACRPDEKSCPMPNLGLLGCPAPPMCIPAKGKNDTNMFLCFVIWCVFRNWLLYKLTSKQVKICYFTGFSSFWLFYRTLKWCKNVWKLWKKLLSKADLPLRLCKLRLVWINYHRTETWLMKNVNHI